MRQVLVKAKKINHRRNQNHAAADAEQSNEDTDDKAKGQDQNERHAEAAPRSEGFANCAALILPFHRRVGNEELPGLRAIGLQDSKTRRREHFKGERGYCYSRWFIRSTLAVTSPSTRDEEPIPRHAK